MDGAGMDGTGTSRGSQAASARRAQPNKLPRARRDDSAGAMRLLERQRGAHVARLRKPEASRGERDERGGGADGRVVAAVAADCPGMSGAGKARLPTKHLLAWRGVAGP